MTQQFRTVQLGSPGLTLGMREGLASAGIPSQDEQRDSEILWNVTGLWRAGLSAFVDVDTITMTGVTVDTANDRIPYVGHHFADGEPLLFLGTGRPNVAGVHGEGGSSGLIKNEVQFYVKRTGADTFEVHGSRELDDLVDFTDSGDATSWTIRRNVWFYMEEDAGGSVGKEVYNTIGAPTETTANQYPLTPEYADVGFEVPPMALASGGVLEGEITGMLKQGGTGDRVLYFVIDPDPDVRANGYLLFTATCVGATDVWTKVAHGLRNGDVVQLKINGAAAATAAEDTNLWVRRIDADSFYLCSDAKLTTIVDASADGEMNVRLPPDGGRKRIKFAFTVPNTVSTVQAITITDATWVLNTLTLTSTGDFAGYVPRVTAVDDGSTGDFYETTSTNGGWTDNKRYPVASRTSDDAIVLLDPDEDAPADDAIGVSDGVLYHLDYVPFVLTWKFIKDVGEQSLTSAVATGVWIATLEIPASAYINDKATTSTGYRVSQSVHKTFPRRGVNFNETRRQDFGPHSRVRYYPTTQPTFTYAVDEEITGGTTGAIGIVIDHDIARQSITFRPKAIDEDFIAGETLTGSSGSLTAGPIERGPFPIRMAQRIAVDGVQDGSFDVWVKSSRGVLHHARPLCG